MTSKRFYRGLLLTCFYIIGVSGILATGGSDDDDDDDDRVTYTYNITSATYFTGGEQVAVIRLGFTGSCLNPTGITGPITRVGSGTVNNPGSVSFSFKTDITPPMLESVYIDNNASGNLDNGDRVWGDDPNDAFGLCFDAFSSDQTFDWEDIADQIELVLGTQGSIIYTGAPQSYRGDFELNSELMFEKTIIADGDGYQSINTVTLDIEPGSTSNSFGPGSNELITVAVLGSTDFDATQIDFSTVQFGAGQARPVHDGHVEDVNGDGFYDMVFHFKIEDTGILCGYNEEALSGKTFQGSYFTGTDSVKLVGCE